MKPILRSLPALLFASAATAHESPHVHHHLTDPNWMPLAVGLSVIVAAGLLAWFRK